MSVPIAFNTQLDKFLDELIQTFPEDFILDIAKTNANTLIGNAVPVKLAEYVARILKRHIDG